MTEDKKKVCRRVFQKENLWGSSLMRDSRGQELEETKGRDFVQDKTWRKSSRFPTGKGG